MAAPSRTWVTTVLDLTGLALLTAFAAFAAIAWLPTVFLAFGVAVLSLSYRLTVPPKEPGSGP